MTVGHRILTTLGVFFENMAKARVNSVLLATDREQLKAWGYSYEALRQGPKAWPWRLDSEPDAARLPRKATLTAAETRIDIELDELEIRRDAA